MLAYDPSDRITCQKALEHPWIKQKVHLELSPDHLNEAIGNLKSFTVYLSAFIIYLGENSFAGGSDDLYSVSVVHFRYSRANANLQAL
jgi:hypothetical protein